VGIERRLFALAALIALISGCPAPSFAGDSISASEDTAGADRGLLLAEPSEGPPSQCFLVDGSKITTTVAGCRESKGDPNKDRATLTECLMRDGSSLLTTGAACEAAGGARLGAGAHPDGGQFEQAVAAYGRGDFAAGFRLLRPLVDKADARARDFLGHVYEDGQGVKPDLAQAAKWYRLAGDQGLALAQYDLAGLYANGRGVAENPGEAAKWYLKAAEQGYREAETRIGEAYQRGIGVAADFAEAAKWFHNAAEAGSASARLELKLIARFRDALAGHARGDNSEATSALRETLGLDPTFADAYDVAGWVYSAEADQSKAIAAFAKAADLRLRLHQRWAWSSNRFDAPMRVVVVRSSVGCEHDCPEWISAEGQIEGSTPNDFKRVISQIAGKRLPVIIHSPGGNVVAAMAIGRMIRAAKLDVAVGRTLFNGCEPAQKDCTPPDGRYRGMLYSTSAVCVSACPLILAAGERRLVGTYGTVAVHEPKTTYVKTITTFEIQYQLINGKKVILSKTPVSTKKSSNDVFTLSQQQESSLSQYLTEMGIDKSLLEIMKATPFTTVERLDYPTMQMLRLVTEKTEAETLVDPGLCSAQAEAANCVSAAAPATRR
jgi:hypothetical protein